MNLFHGFPVLTGIEKQRLASREPQGRQSSLSASLEPNLYSRLDFDLVKTLLDLCGKRLRQRGVEKVLGISLTVTNRPAEKLENFLSFHGVRLLLVNKNPRESCDGVGDL